MPYIAYLHKGLRKYFKLPEDKMVIFGREEHVDFQIPDDPLVSREHFSIEKDETGKFIIIDLGSRNGTYLNGKKLEANAVTPLTEGDKIKIGSKTLIFTNKIEKNNTADILNQVASEYEKGKGYSTILKEIIGKNKPIKK